MISKLAQQSIIQKNSDFGGLETNQRNEIQNPTNQGSQLS